jgi:hypothetical protein
MALQLFVLLWSLLQIRNVVTQAVGFVTGVMPTIVLINFSEIYLIDLCSTRDCYYTSPKIGVPSYLMFRR